MPRDESGAHSPEQTLGCAKNGAYPNIHENWKRQNQSGSSDANSGEAHPERERVLDRSSPALSPQVDATRRGICQADGQVDPVEVSLDDQLQLALSDSLENAGTGKALPTDAAWTQLDESCRQLVEAASADQREPRSQPDKLVAMSDSPAEPATGPVRWAPQGRSVKDPHGAASIAPPATKTEVAKQAIFQRNPGMAIAAGVMAFMAIASGYAITNGVAGTLKEVHGFWPIKQAHLITAWFNHAPSQLGSQTFYPAEEIRFARLVEQAKSDQDTMTDFNPEIVLARMAFSEPNGPSAGGLAVKAWQDQQNAQGPSRTQAEPPLHAGRHEEGETKPAFEFDQELQAPSLVPPAPASHKIVAEHPIAANQPDPPTTTGNGTNGPEIENRSEPVQSAALMQKPDKTTIPTRSPTRQSKRLPIGELRKAFQNVRGLDLLAPAQKDRLIVRLAEGECLVPALSDYFVKVPVVTMRDLAQFIDTDC